MRALDVMMRELYKPVAQKERQTAYVTCGYCRGTGANPPSSVCPACSGRGYNQVALPYKACPACGGDGDVDSSRCTCATCGGKGVVSVQERSEEEHPSQSGGTRLMQIRCEYCWGRGVDPFGCPGPKSRCQVCGGKGYNSVTPPIEKCKACGATGKVPGRRLACSACKGKGVVRARIPEQRQTCSHCQGSGTDPETSFPCTQCGGQGVVTRRLRIQPVPKVGVTVGGKEEADQTRRRREARSMGHTPPGPTSLEDRVSSHITTYPGIGVAAVQALFGLSKSEAERMLQGLVRARKIKKKEELYHPA